MKSSIRLAFAVCLAAAGLFVPVAADAEHCAGANFVDALQPREPEIWKIGETRYISWEIGDNCGYLTYQVEVARNGGSFEIVGVTDPLLFYGVVEYPWIVTGPAQSEVQFRVKRVVPDRVLPYAYTAAIQIRVSVATRESSWAALRARF